jgi:hypothetical protein
MPDVLVIGHYSNNVSVLMIEQVGHCYNCFEQFFAVMLLAHTDKHNASILRSAR